MKFSIAKTTFIALAVVASTSLCAAAAGTAGTPQLAASQAAASANDSRGKAPVAGKAATLAKLVDINSASKAELKKLPGIDDADVAKIIAGRPYGSKAWLVTRKVISEDKYPGLKDLVMAKQPSKDAAKNAALDKTKK